MIYTPSMQGYITVLSVSPGNSQIDGQAAFKAANIGSFELTKSVMNPDGSTYHPFLIDISYSDGGRHYAILSSGVFTRGQDGSQEVDGALITN